MAPVSSSRRWPSWFALAMLATAGSGSPIAPPSSSSSQPSPSRRQLSSSVDFLPNQTLPDYAIQFAPYVYLYSDEKYWPSDPYDFLTHVAPYRNYSPIANPPSPLNATTIDSIRNQDGFYLTVQPYLSTLQQPMPDWLFGAGAPDANGRGPAPSLILAIDKAGVVGPGWVDVFYMLFYSWNEGNGLYGNIFGSHVGDLEQTMIRFANGTPMYIVPEAHGAQEALGSQAYTYDAIEKRDGRPVVYSANGTHGMYPVAGMINYTGISQIPLFDQTDQGHLLDPTLNARKYFYSGDGGFYPTNDTTDPADRATGWLDFGGYWGDQQYNYSVINQTCVGDECFYSSGPQGPKSKSITRGWICASDCTPETTLPVVLPAPSSQQNADSAATPRRTAPGLVAAALAVGLALVL